MSRIDWRKLASRLSKIAVFGLTAVAGLLIVGAIGFVAVPRALNWQGIVVLTGSMEPKLPTGSLVFVERDIDPAGLEAGDIITFQSAGSGQVTHRIVAVTTGAEGPEYQTKGDANSNPDAGLVKPSAVRGRVVATIPQAGSWSNSLQDKNTFKLFIWPVLGLILLSELSNIVSQVLKGRAKKRASTTSTASPRRPDMLSTETSGSATESAKGPGE